MDQERARQLAQDFGFTNWGFFKTGDLIFMDEVRDMCKANRCGHYATSWICPPACGSLEEIRKEAEKYNWGILVQTTGNMEDAFDAETLVAAQTGQKEAFGKMVLELLGMGEDFLPMGSGDCLWCKKCTYPDAPCRFPEKAYPSIEAYGLIVTDVCKAAGIPYYYGKDTITFSSGVLFK